MKKPLLVILSFLFLACSTRKDIVYYQDSNQVNLVGLDSIYTHPKIQVNSILNIEITSSNYRSVLPFTRAAENQTMQIQPSILKLRGYLVNKNGEINFPELGLIKLEGLTTLEAQNLMEQKLKPYVKDVAVNLRIINNMFTVEGEVNRPGNYEVTDERLTLPQALGMAGGLNIRGQRENVKIIRQLGNNREVKTIDLTSVEWMNTSYFYVHPNDVIYVEPNNPQVKSAGFITNVGTLLSVFSILLTSAVLIFR